MEKNYITPDVIEVKALENNLLYIVFETKEEKIYDMNKNIEKIKMYERLKDKNYFKRVKPRGETIEWQEGEDISPESLYYDSIPVKEYNKQIKELN